jgi:hypothetical protein
MGAMEREGVVWEWTEDWTMETDVRPQVATQFADTHVVIPSRATWRRTGGPIRRILTVTTVVIAIHEPMPCYAWH